MRAVLATCLFLLACTPGSVRRPGFDSADTADTADTSWDSGVDTADTGADTADSDTGIEDTAGDGSCPPHMALVAGAFCIDRYEATLEEQSSGSWVAASPYLTVDGRTVRAAVAPGKVPQGYISGTEAGAACAAAGKRLCTSTEWLSACRGPEDFTWPYGDTYQPGACNDTYAGGHPVVDYFGTSDGIWDPTHMNDPGINQQDGTVAPGGTYTGCVSDWGVYDLHGNLHEWVADASGVFRGGFYADASINGSGCLYATTAHASGYHDYSTGFRCCAEPL